uniref:UDP-glucose 6-dehydrogenase n=1 Tax=uncultured Alphaproteobacteria bacterium TaxID=91750 RepID=A0A6G8F2Z8_9PROT|nr:UDP-glucose 6-dehydrogenase [uncultured Alphaproteobacteria bacterium]
MKLTIIGTGYVGLPTGVGFAELGNEVVCVDKIAEKIDKLNRGEMTLFEDGLEELFRKNVQKGNIRFTLDMKSAVQGADIVMLAVGTPPHPVTKEADLKYIYAAAEELAQYLDGYTVVATKSTVPVGTGDEVESIIRKANPQADFDVVSIPEFLREGFAIHDFFNPDRIVLGANSEKARAVMLKLYEPFKDKSNFLLVKRRSSETIKYASNAFLAMKIHYINEMADFCEKAGADILEVAEGMGLDSRIGKKFLNPGPGYGGSCFPKDTNAMAQMGRKYGAHMNLIETTIAKNDERKAKMGQRVIEAIKNHPDGKIAVLGLAFKGGTDDCRESPAIDIVKEMIKYSDNVCVYDPKAMENAKNILNDAVSYASSAEEACKGADVMVVLTEWEDFRHLDLHNLKQNMAQPKIVDLRNMLNAEAAKAEGFEYQCIGANCNA